MDEEDVDFSTVLPDNDLGEHCIRELRKFGVNTKKILRRPGRVGVSDVTKLMAGDGSGRVQR